MQIITKSFTFQIQLYKHAEFPGYPTYRINQNFQMGIAADINQIRNLQDMHGAAEACKIPDTSNATCECIQAILTYSTTILC